MYLMEQNLLYGYLKNNIMISIGLIDDNLDQRDSFKDAIEIYLKKSGRGEIEVIDCEPFEDINSYMNWINENEIAVLIIDEKLADVPLQTTGKSCGYEGHQMVQILRPLSTIPIHVVTSSIINEDLKDNLELFETVLSRSLFLNNSAKYVEIFIRSGQRFYDENRKRFERIAEISNKIVQNLATTSELIELNGLQEFIQTPMYSKELISRQDLLTEFNADLEMLAKINNEAKEYLNRK